MNECMNERMGKTMMIHDITDFPSIWMITKIVPYMYMSFPLYAPWNLGISQPCLTPLRQLVPCAFPGAGQGGERHRTLQDGGTTPLADLLGIAELVIYIVPGFCGYLW